MTTGTEAATQPRYAFTRDELATALTRLDVRVLTDGPCAGMINADAMAGAILAALHETGTEWGDGAMKMPFEKLMEHVATLSEKDEALTLGELAERWGEPVKRIADAIDAVRVAGGERTYIAIGVDPVADFKRQFSLQQQARDLGRHIITGGGYSGRSHYGAVAATCPQGSRVANADSWRCHHGHQDELSAMECALAEVRRLADGGAYEPCTAGPTCQDGFCQQD